MNNLIFEYKLEIPDDYQEIEGIINSPFIINDVAVGIITEATLVDYIDERYYLCKGVMWDKCVYQEFIKGERKDSITLHCIGIGD